MKFYRVAVSGPTIDGREITAEQINQMAATYNQQTYGARIWMEHLRGLLPDSVFPAYGDVTAVKAEDWTDPLDGQKKRALYAELAPTPALINANQARQKVYFSVEIIKNFANTGKAYLGGLAVTDSPASLGTEMAAFSLAHREKFTGQLPTEDRLYSLGIEADQAFSAANEPQGEPQGENRADTEKSSLFSKIKTLLTGQRRADEDRFADITQAVELLAQQVKDASQAPAAKQTENQTSDLSERLGQLEAKLAELTDLFQKTEQPNQPKRPPATGGDGTIATDC